MSAGCFPIAGDIESIREWIKHEANGLLIDPGSPEQISSAIVRSLRESELREQARTMNIRLVRDKAEYSTCMSRVAAFYEQIISEYRIGSTQLS
jgi:glycosyltransferase involved in cell wall biosynthesis